MMDVFAIGENAIEAALVRREGFALLRGGAELPVRLEPADDGAFMLHAGGRTVRLFLARCGAETFIHMDGETFAVGWEDALTRLARAASGGHADVAIAPMPGTVISVGVEPGQAVARGAALMVIESMKLQTTISAGRDGVVQAVHFAADQTFDRGAVLVTLEAEGA